MGWLSMLRLPRRTRTRSPFLATSGAVPGQTRLLKVKRLKSVMTAGFGRGGAGRDGPLVQHDGEVAVDPRG